MRTSGPAVVRKMHLDCFCSESTGRKVTEPRHVEIYPVFMRL